MDKRHLKSLVVTAAALAYALAANAEPFPARPLKLIVAFPAGGVADAVMRVVAKGLGRELGQPVVVENRTGASGNIGAQAAARSAPDGYTLFNCGVASHGMVPAVRKSLPYDPEKDFAALSKLTSGPNVLVVNPSLPVTSVPQFIEWAKKDKGTHGFASAGIGTSPDMAMELLGQTAGFKLQRVPYKGNAPALNDVIAGHVPVMFGSVGDVRSFIESGQVRAIAVSSLKRSPVLPQVPTFNESGLPGFEVLSWNHLCTPAGVPEPVMEALSAAVINTLKTPDVRNRLTEMGLTAESSSRTELAAFIRSELTKWRKVAAAGNLSLDE